MKAEKAQRILGWLLRGLGILTLSAVVPMLMPTDWMASINDSVGLGPLDRSPLTEYLTRSLSAIYAVIGALTLYVARDVERYLGFVGFAGKLTVLLGFVFIVLDFWAGLPASWSWSEGPATVVLGFGMIWITKQAEDRPAEPPTAGPIFIC